MIATSSDEYLRRFYKISEITERIPKIAKYYRNYLLFFCKPIFSNLFINKLIHVYGELKGELYYNQNYGNKNKENDKDKNDKNNNNNVSALKKNRIKSSDMMFHTTIKNDIDKNSMTISTICMDNSYLNMNHLNDEMGIGNNSNKGNKTQNNFNKFSLNSANGKKNSLPLYYNDKNKDLNLKKSSDGKNIKKNDYNTYTISKNSQKGNNNENNLFNNLMPSNTSNVNRNNINYYAKENLGSKIIRKSSAVVNTKYGSSKIRK